MTSTIIESNDISGAMGSYLDVTREQDGRYCVRFIKNAGVPRKSYADHAAEVVQRAQRIGRITIRTDDPMLRQLCDDHHIGLIELRHHNDELG